MGASFQQAGAEYITPYLFLLRAATSARECLHLGTGKSCPAVPVNVLCWGVRRQLSPVLQLGLNQCRAKLCPNDGRCLCSCLFSAGTSTLHLSSVRELPGQLQELYQQGFVLATVHPFIHPCGPESNSLQHRLYRAILLRLTDG